MTTWVVGDPARPSRWPVVEAVAHLALLIGVIMLSDEIRSLSLYAAANLTTAIALFSLFSVMKSAPRGIWSPSSVFLTTLVLFHCGMTTVVGLGGELSLEFAQTARLWLYRDSTIIALWLMDLALVAFAVGARLAHVRRPARHRRGPGDDELNSVVTLIGATVLVGSLLLWFLVTIAAGGIGILVGSYESFLDATTGSILPLVYQGVNLGVVFLAASRWSRGHRIATIVLAVWVLVAFPLGLRGEILFPIFTGAAVMAAKRVPMRGRSALLLAVAVLAAVALVRDLRRVGLGGMSVSAMTVDPLEGLVELGASMRPVSEVVYWNQMGEDFDHGATYWAPVDRFLVYVVPGWQRPAVQDDSRLMNNLVMERVGPIGFSVVAEAYRNFAATGVFVILLVIGFGLGRMDTWPDGRVYQVVIGVVLVALLNHVRNSFVPVPGQIFLGLALLGAAVVFVSLQAGSRHR